MSDRDTLARDLLTLPALVGAPVEVVRGLVIVSPEGERLSLLEVDAEHGWYIEGEIGCHPTADLHAAGWRVDLDAPATAGVLVGILDDLWECVCVWTDQDGRAYVATSPLDALAVHAMTYDGDTLAEAAARALVEVAS